MRKSGQQEMVGFVLIVVLVVVALMVFLLISLRKPASIKESYEASNLISTMLAYTTDCAITYEPDYDTIQDLIKSCYENRRCENLNRMSCEYMEETINDILDSVMKTESTVTGYEMEIILEDNDGTALKRLFTRIEGNCTGTVQGASQRINARDADLAVYLNFCRS